LTFDERHWKNQRLIIRHRCGDSNEEKPLQNVASEGKARKKPVR